MWWCREMFETGGSPDNRLWHRRGKPSVVPSRRVNRLRYSLVMVLLGLLISSASCGYRFSGAGGLVPEGARAIAIPVFVNGTSEPYVDIEITKAVVDEFLADGRLKVTDPGAADLVLTGRVTKYDVTALSYTSDAYVQQYQVRLYVDARLEDQRTKRVIWQEAGIEAVFISDYPVVYDSGKADIRQTKIAKEAAIKKASRDIAWTLRSRVLEGF